MNAQDELVALFAQNLTLHQPYPTQFAVEQPSLAPQPAPIVYSISQHYTHSAHVVHDAPAAPQVQRPASEPPQVQQPTPDMILREYGVDPSALSLPQLELFKTAEDEQKMRLIELWRICPPNNQQPGASIALDNTSLAQEEMLAQRRYEQNQEEEARRRRSLQSVNSLDGTPLTPVQTEHGQWQASSYTEPYMMSGYEALARRDYEESARKAQQDAMMQAKEVYNHFGSAPAAQQYRTSTDPVYNNHNSDEWIRQQMENNYGAYQQMDSAMEW